MDYATKATGLSRSTLYNLMEQGVSKYFKVGARRLIMFSDLVAFLTNQANAREAVYA